MRRISAVVVACVLAMLVLPDGAQAAPPRLAERECGVLLPTGVSATCYWLTVPEDREQPRGDTVKLAVMVLGSRSQNPEPDPVVFLAGGPGGAAIEGFENFLDSPLLDDRDLILLDQRGTGISEPSLDCPERQAATEADFARAESPDVELEAIRDATRACRERLVDAGIDLDAYDTEANAADVADLRTALQLDEWNLYGVSYGTRLALETMRSHPQGIRAAVLDSVYPPDVDTIETYVSGVDAAFDRLIAACNADDSCSALQPDLDQLLQQVVDRYNDAPVAVSGLTVNGDDVLAGLWDAMYDSDFIPALPSVIDALASGDTSILAVFADQALVDASSEGMFLSVECADNGASKQDLAQDLGHTSVVLRYAAQPYCDLWDVERLPASFNRPVRSKIPTLVLAGSLDPITPASDSMRAAKTLKRSHYVEFAGLGHVVTIPSECSREIRQAFLSDPRSREAELDTSCADVPAPAFLSQGLI